MNKLFNLTRLSQSNRPNINEQCFFSPCTHLVNDIFVTNNRNMLKPYMRENNICTVVNHGDYVEHVRFNKQNCVDIVSIEFLIRKELTEFGKLLLKEIQDENSS